MNRHSTLALAAAILAIPLAATAPAQAASSSFYRAELASPLAEPRREVLGGVVWQCEGSSCTGTKSGSRPVIVCERLAQNVGPVSSFAHPGGALDARAIARCNGE